MRPGDIVRKKAEAIYRPNECLCRCYGYGDRRANWAQTQGCQGHKQKHPISASNLTDCPMKPIEKNYLPK
ncbi:protein of unknown function [Magnetospirillum sp. XM-1]|nr:protein of unknown function [Magnetospirillum sp. XM-1]